jgi:hypothetical protein
MVLRMDTQIDYLYDLLRQLGISTTQEQILQEIQNHSPNGTYSDSLWTDHNTECQEIVAALASHGQSAYYTEHRIWRFKLLIFFQTKDMRMARAIWRACLVKWQVCEKGSEKLKEHHRHVLFSLRLCDLKSQAGN